MAFGNNVNIVGNLTRDPELKFLDSGSAVTNFGVAVNRKYKKDGQEVEEVCFIDCVAWQSLAENVCASLKKGDRVLVSGRLDQRSWETTAGDKRTKVELSADEVSPSLRWAECKVKKTSGSTSAQEPF